MTAPGQMLSDRRVRTVGVILCVVAMHAGVFAIMGRAQPSGPIAPVPPPFDVILFRPSPPPAPEPPPELARVAGGGGPAAPSRVHLPPKVFERPPEPPPVAPETPAPDPPLVVGIAPVESPAPGLGQGGSGAGSGEGVGRGNGPGSGTRPRFVRGPSQREIQQAYPRGALQARQGGRGEIACRIRLDARLEACRIVSETPQGAGFGRATLALATHFRFQPPTENGRPVAGVDISLGVDFDPPR